MILHIYLQLTYITDSLLSQKSNIPTDQCPARIPKKFAEISPRISRLESSFNPSFSELKKKTEKILGVLVAPEGKVTSMAFRK